MRLEVIKGGANNLMVKVQKSLFEYCRTLEIGFQCTIDLSRLFPVPKDRKEFDDRFERFQYVTNNKKIKIFKDKLIYDSEQLIPTKKDCRPPVLFVLGNPATHSIERGMFFTSEGKNGKEHRFWKNILPKAGIGDLCFEGLLEDERNIKRRNALLNLDYQSPYRIGLCVFISFPSNASRGSKNELGDYSGIQGIKRLFGSKAFNELVKHERRRVMTVIREFVTPDGGVFTFQSDAWNELRSEKDSCYSISDAKARKLKGTVAEMHEIRLFGIPPTRLSEPAGKTLRKFLDKISRHSVMAAS
jgi:hypothetical protein